MKKHRHIRLWLAVFVLAACLALAAGCGSGGGTAAKDKAPAPAAALNGATPVRVTELKNFVAFSEREVFNLRQVITRDSTSSRTIMWQSEGEEKGSFVEYRALGSDGKPAGDLYAQGTRRNEKFSEDNQTSWIHTATLNGLQPGTAYQYRLGFGDNRGPWHTLRTAPAGSAGATFKALIFTDSQSSDYSDWQKVAMGAWQRHGDAGFFLNLGDLVDNGQQAFQWKEWFTRIEPMVTAIPAAPVMGNHETYTLDWKVRMPEAYLHLLQLPALPDNLAAKYGNQFYSFDYGDVHFTVLNTQFRELNEFEPDLEKDEAAWFRQDMEQTRKKWKVVLMHKDGLQYSFKHRSTPRPEGFSKEGRLFMPLFDQYGVDVVLSGHLHSYRNRGHIRNFRRDADGPLYIMAGLAGNVRYPDLWKDHALDTKVLPQPETDNYLVLEAGPQELRFRAYFPDGSLADEAVVRK